MLKGQHNMNKVWIKTKRTLYQRKSKGDNYSLNICSSCNLSWSDMSSPNFKQFVIVNIYDLKSYKLVLGSKVF